MGIKIDDSEMMTHIIQNLPEEYQNMVQMIKYRLDDEDNCLTIERIGDKHLIKYDQMDEQSRPKTSREYEKSFYMLF